METFQPDPKLVAEFQKICKKKYWDVPFMQATEDNFAEHGRIVNSLFGSTPIRVLQWPPPGGRGVLGGANGGVEIGELVLHWENDSLFCKKNAEMESRQICIKDGKSVILNEIFAVENGEVLMIPVQATPFVLVLSSFSVEECITPLDFVGFYFDGSCGVMLNPGIWYQAPITEDNSSFLYKKPEGSGYQRIDFAAEFDIPLRVKSPFSVPKASLQVVASSKIARPIDPVSKYPKHPESKNDIETKITGKILLEPISAENVKPFGQIFQDIVPGDTEIPVLPWPNGKRFIQNKSGAIKTSNLSVEWDLVTEDAPNDLLIFRSGRWASAGVTFQTLIYHVDKLYSQIDGAYLLFPLEPASYVILLALSDERGEPIPHTKKGVKRKLRQHFVEISEFVFRLGAKVRKVPIPIVFGAKIHDVFCVSPPIALLVFPEQGLLLKPNVWHSNPIPSNKCKELGFLEKRSAVDARMEFSVLEECDGLISIKVDRDQQKHF